MNLLTRALFLLNVAHVLALGSVAFAAGCGEPSRPAVATPITHTCAGPVEIRDAADLRAARECRVIAGDLRIMGSSLESLSGLEGLTSVRYLVVIGNPELASLEGLRGLRVADGVTISGNSALRDLTGLSGVTSLEGLVVTDNGVVSMAGLENLRSAGDVVIASNASLASLAGLDGLAQVDGELDVSMNAALPDRDAARIRCRAFRDLACISH